MKRPLVLALSLAPLACAGAEPAPATPAKPMAPPVVVDLTPPPSPSAAPRPEAPKPETAAVAEAPRDEKHPISEEDLKEAAQYGIIGVLSADPNAPSPPWGKADAATGNMFGNGTGEAFGAGGLGLSGIGQGGGGIGLGNIGTLGHGAGFGSGHGRLGGREGTPPKVRMGATTVTGRLPPEVIQRIVRQNFGRFRLCYENGLRSKPKLGGKITVRFVIDEQGAVGKVTTAGSDLPDTGVVACVARAFSNLSFPQPEGGKVTVVYPITFSPAEDAKPPPSGTAPVTSAATSPLPPAPAKKKP